MAIHVRNGTPIGSQSRCGTCEHSHILRGFRESEDVTYCYYATLIVVPFKVRDCSNYSDKTHPTWDQMKDLAIEVGAVTYSRTAGFRDKPAPENEVVVVDDADTR